MPKPLSLVVDPGASWTRTLAYGDPVPPELRWAGGEVAEYVLLSPAGPGQHVRAAAAGYLSVRMSSDDDGDPARELTPDPDPDVVVPETLLVHLHPRPILDLYPGFSDRARGVLDAGGARRVTIEGFVYLNLATASVRTALATALDATTVPHATTEMERERRWRLFLAGEVDLAVDAGQVLGSAGLTTPVAGTPPSPQVGFAVLTSAGTVDPSRLYDHLRDFVVDEHDVDDWLALVPQRWPLLDPVLTADEVVDATQDALFPWSTLTAVRTTRALSRAQWRQVRAHQKALYRRRLLRRTGHAPPNETSPPFEFNDLDWRNLFQLEAVVEYYANFTEPWDVVESPTDPTDPAFVQVDLLPPDGAAATVNGTVLTPGPGLDLAQVWPGRDLVVLEADTARPSQTYRIVSVDTAAGTVTLDAAPVLGGATTSSWRLRPRPVLVAIDPFGGRFTGQAAQVVTPGLQAVVRLDATAAYLKKVNAHGFETITFFADTRAHLPPRTYQILSANPTSRTVTLDGNPSFTGGVSAWTLPAGVGGRLPPLVYALGTPVLARGHDHYDAVLFTVLDGEVTDQFRFTTYTSHQGDPATALQTRSSLRGNARYVIGGFTSSDGFKGFSFSVMDAEGLVRSPSAWTLNYDYDGVRDARFYFEPVVTGDVAPAGTPPGLAGKKRLRIHYGNRNDGRGSGSKGCVVSPSYFALRARLVEHYQDERVALLGPDGRDPQAAAIAAHLDPGIRDSRQVRHWASTPASHWQGKITGYLWVVRPDERPLG